MASDMTTVTLSRSTRERLRAVRFGAKQHRTVEDAVIALLEEHDRAELRAMFDEIDPDEYRAALVDDELVPGVTDYRQEDSILLAQDSTQRSASR